MSTQDAPRHGRLDAIRKLIRGEESTPAAQPARHENWRVEQWKRQLAARTPRQAAAEGADPKYTVERPISLREECIEREIVTFVVVIGNPAFAADLSRDGEWTASVFPLKRPVRRTTSLGRILCRPGTDKTGAIENADTWIHDNFHTVLEKTQRPFAETINPDPSGLDREGEKHGAFVIYKVPLPN